MTIIEAIKEAMRLHGGPMTIREAFQSVQDLGLYAFHAESPVHVVASKIRQHCKGLDFPSASDTKHFEIKGDGKYYFLSAPIKQRGVQARATGRNAHKSLLRELKSIHHRYDAQLREVILDGIRRLDARTFEHFAKKLLEAYGFLEVHVTPYSKDGGIDGFGKLKVGLADLNVKFQCKRFTKTAVGRPEIDQFRGAIQGQCEQGIFFTTSRFAKGAEAASFRPGAVPIILIDGPAIVDLMIDKRFGVQVEEIPVYSYALDLIFADDDESETETTAKVPV